jgi:CHAT domain-containing protein/tetratricopeptide (TPR) repeat protein
VACSPRRGAQESFDLDYRTFVHGDLLQGQNEAHRDFQRFQVSNPEWAWKFKILEAESLLWQGMYEQVLSLLDSPSNHPKSTNSIIEILAIDGVAHAGLHKFPEAERALMLAAQMCQASAELACGDVMRARGVLAVQHGQIAAAKQYFAESLQFARVRNDHFLEETALLNLGLTSLRDGRFDEAIDWTEAAYQAATNLQAGGEAQAALGNLGWAYYNLGDFERSIELSLEAEKRAIQVGDAIDQLYWTTNIGYVYAGMGHLALAKQSYLKALDLATRIKGKEGIYNALRALAILSVENDELDAARKYSDEAIAIARADGNRLDELYPLLVSGLVAARLRNGAEAERIFRDIKHDINGNASLKWRAEHGLARLYEDESRPSLADAEYRAALGTFEAARSSLKRSDSKLPFSNNAARIYDDYIHFLIAHGKTNDALRWADYSRARTLAEGLGLLTKGKDAHTGPPPLSPREISRRTQGTLLFYWLGEKQSYLWAITPKQVSLFPLPPGAQIDSLVQRYRSALSGPQDVLASEDGRALYRTLIAPAKALLPNNAKVFIIPDGSLNNLNFETLVVPDPKPHYWIEDADVVSASSLRVLAASRTRKYSDEDMRKTIGEKNHSRQLLLIGNSIAPSKEYPELPRAGEQMASVARHFPVQQQIYQRDQATPAAYLTGNPEKFSYIHFVAHGTASRLSPLDSAIVLSKGPVETAAFKLYARDIVQHRLHADLVTISACYGAGSRAYSGEGLVGLAWAFLRAGAHNVIASLWEVTDASTEQLMDRFYDELDKGSSPDAALRTAKLSLLHGSAFHNPFYWAPFQLYTGS